MIRKVIPTIVTFLILTMASCASRTETVLPSPAATETAIKPTATSTAQPATQTLEAKPTLISVSKESLAGLIISSPILGSPIEVPGVQPPETITTNGLGIINSDGRLVKFSDAGLFESFSPSGVHIVYQHGFQGESRYIDNLFVYNSMTGESVEVFDDLENEGRKTVVSWLPDERQFMYYNDYQAVLFEAYGYFEPKELFLADIATAYATLLISDGYQFDASPDQMQVAYTTGEILDSKSEPFKESQALQKFGCFQPHIYDIASASSQLFEVNQLNEKPVCLGYPKWSPDGKQIAWMGYFEDETFRPVIFDLQNGTGRIYAALDQKPESSLMPTFWFFGIPYFGGYFEPDWIDNSTFWTPSYEVNLVTGETSTPREIALPYDSGRDEHIESLNGLFHVSLNEERDSIMLTDKSDNVLASFVLDHMYDGPRHEILTSPFFPLSITSIVGWSPFAPPPDVGNN